MMAESPNVGALHSFAPVTPEKDREGALLRRLYDIPTTPVNSRIGCCCGRKDCDFVAHTSELLTTAAELGQALLIRHEAYVAEAEKDRARMDSVIESLEDEKRVLQAENAKSVEENRGLLDHLEEMNKSIGDSEVELETLKSRLLSTQHELHRVSMMAARTKHLEIQLEAMEQEHDQLHQALIAAQGQERKATQRWRKAERNLNNLQDGLEKLELETAEEREEHAAGVARLQRVQEMRTGMTTRSRSLTQVREHDDMSDGITVTSRFMQDVLQDNMKLQSDLMELRDMLLKEHEETERLQEQLVLQQEVCFGDGKDEHATTPAEHLALELSRAVDKDILLLRHQREVVHTARGLTTARSKPSGGLRRSEDMTRPRRPGYANWAADRMSSGTASTASQSSRRESSANSGLLTLHRWSQTTNATVSTALSSVPSTPPSSCCFPSIFESAGETASDSRPTTPESCHSGPATPTLNSSQHRVPSQSGLKSSVPFGPVTGTRTARSMAPPLLPRLTTETISPDDLEGLDFTYSSQITRSPSHQTENEASAASDQPPLGRAKYQSASSQRNPLLRRAASHESLLSVSGMAVPHLGRQSSQQFVNGKGFLPRLGSSTSMASAGSISNQPVVGSMSVNAGLSTPRNPRSSSSSSSSAYNRSLLQTSQRSSTGGGARLAGGVQLKDVLGVKLGDWGWGKWGGKAQPSSSSPSRKSLADAVAKSTPLPLPTQPKPVTGRKKASNMAPGIMSSEVNVALLREALLE